MPAAIPMSGKKYFCKLLPGMNIVRIFRANQSYEKEDSKVRSHQREDERSACRPQALS